MAYRDPPKVLGEKVWSRLGSSPGNHGICLEAVVSLREYTNPGGGWNHWGGASPP